MVDTQEALENAHREQALLAQKVVAAIEEHGRLFEICGTNINEVFPQSLAMSILMYLENHKES
jgi:hypothetical protein